MSRKPIPDKLNILDQLQGVKTRPLANQPRSNESEEVDAKTDASETSAEGKTPAASPVEVERSAPAKIEKIKVNLHLNAAVKRRTEQAQIDLRNLVPQKSGGKINYSMIVETALQIVLDEFDADQENSRLSREVKKQL